MSTTDVKIIGSPPVQTTADPIPLMTTQSSPQAIPAIPLSEKGVTPLDLSSATGNVESEGDDDEEFFEPSNDDGAGVDLKESNNPTPRHSRTPRKVAGEKNSKKSESVVAQPPPKPAVPEELNNSQVFQGTQEQRETAKKSDKVGSERLYFAAAAVMITGFLGCCWVAFQSRVTISFPWKVAVCVMGVGLGVFGTEFLGRLGFMTKIYEGLEAATLVSSQHLEAFEDQPVGIVQENDTNLCFFNVFLQGVMHVRSLEDLLGGHCIVAAGNKDSKGGHLGNFVAVYDKIFSNQNGLRGIMHLSREAPSSSFTNDEIYSVLLLLAQDSIFQALIDKKPELSGILKPLMERFKTAIKEKKLDELKLSQEETNQVGDILKKIKGDIQGKKQTSFSFSSFVSKLRYVWSTSPDIVVNNDPIIQFLKTYKDQVDREIEGYKALFGSMVRYGNVRLAQNKARIQQRLDLRSNWGFVTTNPLRHFLKQDANRPTQEDPTEFLDRVLDTKFVNIHYSDVQCFTEDTEEYALLDLGAVTDEKKRRELQDQLTQLTTKSDQAQGDKNHPDKRSPFPEGGIIKTPQCFNYVRLNPEMGMEGQLMLDRLTVGQDHLPPDLNNLSCYLNSEGRPQFYYKKSMRSRIISPPQKCLIIKIDRWKADNTKNLSRVNMPPEIEFGGKTYQKKVFIEHRGESLKGGHYLAHVIQGEKRWFIDDREVTEESPVEETRIEDRYSHYIYEILEKPVNQPGNVLVGQVDK